MATASHLMEHSEQQTSSRLGGIAAILIGLLNLIVVIYVVAATEPQRFDADQSIRYFAENPLALSVAWIVFSISGVLAYAAIPAAVDFIRSENREWVRAATLYGIIGYTVQAVWAVTLIRTAPNLAHNFVTGDAVTQKAVLAMWLPEIDPDGWFSFGGPGTWLIIMNWLALRNGRLARFHAYAGILLGIGLWATVFAAAMQYEPLNLFAASVGAVLYPVWFIWTGVRLLREQPKEAGAWTS